MRRTKHLSESVTQNNPTKFQILNTILKMNQVGEKTNEDRRIKNTSLPTSDTQTEHEKTWAHLTVITMRWSDSDHDGSFWFAAY